MPYIHNGKVVGKKPFSLIEFLANMWALFCFFVTSIFSTAPMTSQIDAFEQRRRPGATTLGWGYSLRRAFQTPSSGPRGPTTGGAATAPRPGSNIHTLPQGPASNGAGCGCGCPK